MSTRSKRSASFGISAFSPRRCHGRQLVERPDRSAVFELPTINVGDRQRGRLRAPNVIDCESSVGAVAKHADARSNSEFPRFAHGHGKSIRQRRHLRPDSRRAREHERRRGARQAFLRPAGRSRGGPQIRFGDGSVKLVVVGAGGHARSVIDAIRSGGRARSRRVHRPAARARRDGDRRRPDRRRRHATSRAAARRRRGACLGLGGAGDNGPRARLFEHLEKPRLRAPAHRPPVRDVAGSATIGRGHRRPRRRGRRRRRARSTRTSSSTPAPWSSTTASSGPMLHSRRARCSAAA